MIKKAILIIFTVFLCMSCSVKETNVLVFTKTAGYRHKSIETGKQAFKKWATAENWKISFTENEQDLNDEKLKNIDVVVFMNTTENVFDEKSKKAFKKYIQNGGGFVGLHGASDTEFEWEWYTNMIGAQFRDHPKIQKAKLLVNTAENHPAIKHLEETFYVTDEWYNFKEPVSENVTVLISLDETSYEGKKMDGVHPISWIQEYKGGRIFYTGMGHTKEIYSNPLFVKHIVEGVNWASN
ncbi:ThuA domain-containing protein [Polaribacter sp.]|nr:ThuA domain-containing protein [Polaribacter sp.]